MRPLRCTLCVLPNDLLQQALRCAHSAQARNLSRPRNAGGGAGAAAKLLYNHQLADHADMCVSDS